MDPQLKSVLTTLLTLLFGSLATWLITKGFISSDQGPVLVNSLVGVAFGLGAAVLAWLKSREHSPSARVLSAKEVPGVVVQVDTSRDSPAPDKVQALANDPKVADVVPAPQSGPVSTLTQKG